MGNRALVLAFLIGPASWALQLGVQYASTPLLCGTKWTPALHAVTGVAFTLTLSSFLWARRARRRLEKDEADVPPAPRVVATRWPDVAPESSSSAAEKSGPNFDDHHRERRSDRVRSMIGMAIAIDVFFLVVIVVQGLPLLSFDPCW